MHIRLSSWKQLACFASSMKQIKHMVFANHVFIHCILCQAFFFIYCMLKQCNDRSPMFSSVFFCCVRFTESLFFLQLGIIKKSQNWCVWFPFLILWIPELFEMFYKHGFYCHLKSSWAKRGKQCWRFSTVFNKFPTETFFDPERRISRRISRQLLQVGFSS